MNPFFYKESDDVLGYILLNLNHQYVPSQYMDGRLHQHHKHLQYLDESVLL